MNATEALQRLADTIDAHNWDYIAELLHPVSCTAARSTADACTRSSSSACTTDSTVTAIA
ncbi:hypothetical protein [Microbacterium esteraromaticum]|uniref:hypothetical protein n=1 Tax=Microbacterium esteraromaticum TaxID=57043 RepID=UPI001C96E960|nr:hypothetical protein [Microbacterium esteraromaticum]MBY6062067.1 hypothetical protein [Microbacterium esteraromaticum]